MVSKSFSLGWWNVLELDSDDCTTWSTLKTIQLCMVFIFLFIILFLVTPASHRSSQARDWTYTIAMTWALQWQCWLLSLLSHRRPPQLYTLKGWLLWHVNSLKKKKKSVRARGSIRKEESESACGHAGICLKRGYSVSCKASFYLLGKHGKQCQAMTFADSTFCKCTWKS